MILKVEWKGKIKVGVIARIIIVGVLIKAACGWSTVSNCEKDGHEAFRDPDYWKKHQAGYHKYKW